MNVPFNNLKIGFELYQTEYEQTALDVLRSGWYILGEHVSNFEAQFAKACDVKHCIGVDNGLNAIALGLDCLGIGVGDEVIVQANTYIATVLGITRNQATPIFIEPDHFYNIDASKVENSITARTKAIMVTHLYGQASEMDKLIEICNQNGLILIEDCAQAHFAEFKGKKVGTFGTLGFFSFYPTKNVGAFGDAGAIITDNDKLAEKLKALRNYGSYQKYHNSVLGYNSRLDELQAALLSKKLGHIGELTDHRKLIAEKYCKEIQNPLITLPEVRPGASHVWHLYVIRVEKRDFFRDYLWQHGIGSEVHYPIPPHLSGAYEYLGYKRGSYPITEAYSKTVVSLPIFDGMKIEEADWVIQVINAYRE